MPGRTTWVSRTPYKRILRDLTSDWGAKKILAIETGIPESTISNWAQSASTALPNVEQAYFIAEALGQNLLDMISGIAQPRLPDPLARALQLLKELPAEQQRLVVSTIEAFANSARPIGEIEKPSELPTGQPVRALIKSPPKTAPALPPAAASSKDEVHEPAPEYGSDMVELPLHYGLAAGEPMDTFFASDVYKVGKSRLKGSAKNYAAFVVAGTSMVNADINDGDTVIIRKDPEARDGRIHLFRHDGQFALKRFRRGDKGSARLAYDDGSGRSVAVGPGEWKVIGAFAFVAERKRG